MQESETGQSLFPSYVALAAQTVYKLLYKFILCINLVCKQTQTHMQCKITLAHGNSIKINLTRHDKGSSI